MNTSKQVNVMIGLLFVAFLAFGAYFATEPAREATAREVQAELMADRGAHIYVANCRSCHGLQGMGSDEGGLAPRLNNIAFLVLAEQNVFGVKATPAGEANDVRNFLHNTIACGRSNTVMPTWSDRYGGPLSTTQINYLVTMMTNGRWDLVHEVGEEHDASLQAQHAAALAMFGKPYDDPTVKDKTLLLTPEQKKSVDAAITAGTAKKFADMTKAEQDAVHAALSKSILAPDPASLTPTTKNCGQYGAAVLDFRGRNPLASGPATSAAGGATDPVSKGKELAAGLACASCHTADGKASVGPTWKGLAGHDVELAAGGTVKADDAYIKESITNPNAKVVKGFAAGVMPQTFGTQLTPEQIDQLVAYINSLK